MTPFRMPLPATDTNEKRRLLLAAVLLMVLTAAAIPRPIQGAVPAFSGRPADIGAGQGAEIRSSREGFQLFRNGRPYPIKGIGGTEDLETAARLGANSIRTWSAQHLGTVLERADRCGMSVLAGIWLSHDPAHYRSDAYKDRKTREVLQLVDAHRGHPALLMWALGNEVNLGGADTPAAWRFIDELAAHIHRVDPDHPVISVIAWKPATLDRIAAWAPRLDAVGINAYGALPDVRTKVEATVYRGPYLITEWGVTGHWEAHRTSWGRPIEPASAAKAAMVRAYYRHIADNADRCLGSYVFLWGQKQERTPTWYSMLIRGLPDTGAAPMYCPTVDAMAYNWSGDSPANPAPAVTGLRLNGLDARGDPTLTPGQMIRAEVDAAGNAAERLAFVWEVLEEPAVLSTGGAHEPHPPAFGRRVQSRDPIFSLRAPATPGAYRLFVYVVGTSRGVGTANIPFLVEPGLPQ